ncbi:MAG: metal-dependent phosphohydrolase [Proteobacteria bacterium]|nr:metal-dependent phosphohydrolase [Pseudomonadota bacterium]
MAKSEEMTYYIRPEQLCLGLFIHLDLSWMDHPFTFSSFKIKSADQIETLQHLGLEKIRYSPTKSDQHPLPKPEDAALVPVPAAVPVVELSQEEQAILDAKRQRLEHLKAQRAAIEACEKDFMATARTVRGLDRAIFSRPRDCALAGERLVNKLVDSLMTDKDIAIHLMNDRAGAEDLYFHSLNVTVLALMLGKELKFSREEICALGQAALFHDVGKIEIPDRILLKTEPLNRSEQALYEQHAEWSTNATQKAGLSSDILMAIAQHHEMVDGSGYPKKLKQGDMHPLARTLALVNYFDELCNRTSLEDSHTPHEALALMFAQQRGKFDAQALNVFIRCMGIYPPGSLVMLSNESYAMVVSVNSSRPLKPQVLVHIPGTPPNEAPLIDLEHEHDLNISKSLKPAQLPREALECLNPRKRMTYFFAPKDND